MMQIDLEDVEEEYAPNPKLFREGDAPIFTRKAYRTRFDNPNEKLDLKYFGKDIVHQLETDFPGPRDYKAIVPEPKPQDYYPDKINEFLEYIAKYTKQVYISKWRD